MSVKIVLPQVETCRWRRPPDSAEPQAICGLARSFLEQTQPGVGRVSHEQCRACCESFPPSPRQLNPVVASLVVQHATRLLGEAGCGPAERERLQGKLTAAAQALRDASPHRESLTPAREQAECFFTGPPRAPLRDDQSGSQRECRHPQHEVASPQRCRACRDWTRKRPISRRLSLPEQLPLARACASPSIRSWAVGVTTSPRRESTLAACLDSVVRAGWSAPRLFLDGTVAVPERFGHLDVSWRETPIGAMAAWLAALTELVLQQPQADAYLLLQDDVVLHDRDNLRPFLETSLWPGEERAVVSLFYSGLETRGGWYRSESDWHWGAQALVFPPALARLLITDGEPLQRLICRDPGVHLPIPEELQRWQLRHRVPIWYPVPSLAQHIGNSSTLWDGAALTRGRRAPWYSGSLDDESMIEEDFAAFPESRFPVPAGPHRTRYRAAVHRGGERMRQLRAVICGLCRDVRPVLPRTARRIEALGAMFADYRVVVFENDSVDATAEFLKDWSEVNSKVEVLTARRRAPKFPSVRCLDRAAAMADYRNQYLRCVREHYADHDVVVVVDTDLIGGWSYEGIAHTFSVTQWDAVGSYGVVEDAGFPPEFPFRHYDTWAFRPTEGCPRADSGMYGALRCYRGGALLPVRSCFGGLAVYKMSAFVAASYAGGDCEHVTFHARMRAQGFARQFLNPNQITLYSPT